MNKKQKKVLIRIIISSILLIITNIFIKNIFLILILSIASYLIIGYDILKKAVRGIINLRPFDENFLMMVATIGAIVLALYSKNYDFNEAIIVMLLYQIGELFQNIATSKSRKNILNAMDIRPNYANIEINGEIKKVDPLTLDVGSLIIVNPGEKIPFDGIVIDGTSSIDTSALTGESLPRSVEINDEVLSGSINLNSVLKIKTTKLYNDSTASKILDLIENASSKKSKSENFISKFARFYTPIICICAFLLGVVPPIINLIINKEAHISTWIYRALTFLVISCPCALVISIPLSFFSGLGSASKKGILIKGSNYLETLANVKTVVFDKTGTLTQGVFVLKDIHHNTINEKELLEYAALAESYSNHPIAKSIKKAYGKKLDLSRIKNIN